MSVERVGVSIPSDLLQKFDRLVEKKGYENRSKAIRDLVRDSLIAEEAETRTGRGLGSVTLVYDHSVTSLTDKLMELQHEYHEMIVSSLHVHLTRHLCLEVVVLHGMFQRVKEVADHLISLKGVRHGKLIFTSGTLERRRTDEHPHDH